MNFFKIVFVAAVLIKLTLQSDSVEHVSLNSTNSTIPLESINVRASIIDNLAKVQIVQVFVNNESHALECVYTFPLDEKSSITEFIAEINGHQVFGVSKPKEQAAKEYQEAIQQGHTAYLMQEKRADIFAINIGNLPAHTKATITITYLTELGLEGDHARFILPTTIAPRYVPFIDATTVGSKVHPSTNEILNPPTADEVPYTFSVNIDVQMPSTIVKVASPTHPLDVELNGDQCHVFLPNSQIMDVDLVMTIEMEKPNESRAWIEISETSNETAILLSLYPSNNAVKSEEGGEAKTIIFIVDVSGSMQGDKLQITKNALRTALAFLYNPADERTSVYFNIVSFSNVFQMLFDGPVELNQANFDKADSFIQSLYASGGTELYNPLRKILSSGVELRRKQQVIVITDGEVSDTDRIIQMVGTVENRAFNRIFSIGIGNAVSHLLVNGIARAGDGISEFVIPGEHSLDKIIRQMARIGLNSLEINSIQWTQNEGSEVVFQTPYLLPTLYAQSKLVAYAIINGPIPSQIVVSTVEGETIILEGSAIQIVEGDIIHKLAARSRIRDLEESRCEIQPQSVLVVQSIIDLAVKYNLMSRETSFIAVDETQHSDPQTSVHRQIPLKSVRDTYNHRYDNQNDATFASSWSFMLLIFIVLVSLFVC